MRLCFHASAAAILLGLAAPVSAQAGRQLWTPCANVGGAYPVEVRIDNCSAIIDANEESAENLALALNNRGWAYNDRRDYALALRDLDRAIGLNPRLAWAWSNRGISHGGRGEHRRAIADHDEAIRLDPAYAGAYNNRGVARYHLRDHAGARADYDAAIRLDPAYALAWRNRALSYEAEGNLGKAVADAREAVRLAPANAAARADLSRLLDAYCARTICVVP